MAESQADARASSSVPRLFHSLLFFEIFPLDVLLAHTKPLGPILSTNEHQTLLFSLPFFLLRITEQIHQSLPRLHTEAKEPKTEKTDGEETPAPLLFWSANQWTREVTSPSENQASGEVNKESVGTGAKQQSTDIPAAINRKKKHTQQLKKKKSGR